MGRALLYGESNGFIALFRLIVNLELLITIIFSLSLCCKVIISSLFCKDELYMLYKDEATVYHIVVW